MTILLSPSEGKQIPLKQCAAATVPSILDDPMWGGHTARKAHITNYLKELTLVPETQLCKIFGTKRISLQTLSLCTELTKTPRIRAIELYNGVAFKALDFASLDSRAQEFILESVLIFSNLFGLVRAFDYLPFYHLNQNYRSSNLSLKTLYLTQQLEIQALLTERTRNSSPLIDLRAQIYIKACPIHLPHYILSLPSQTSHQAKLYRGKALRNLALFIASKPNKSQLHNYLMQHFTYITP